MLFRCTLKIEDVVTPAQLADLFEVKTLKTSRFIKEKNAVVIIADYVKHHHPDKWIGNTFHYTGGAKITGVTNSKLADCRTNGVAVYLFQCFEPDALRYAGCVTLAGDPYTEMQPDKSGDNRLVWVFPLKPHRADRVSKPDGLVFASREDFENRGAQAYIDFLRRRSHYIGCRVKHVDHGEGTIRAFDGRIVTVEFDHNQTKTYHFHKSINGGYLQFLD